MNWFYTLFTSSIGKKILMALTGLFLISFLAVHGTINAMIFYNDGGVTFSHWAHFMGTNPVIRTLEIVLIVGFLLHIIRVSCYGDRTGGRVVARGMRLQDLHRRPHGIAAA